MSRRNRNEKEAARLRREVEILKAQLAAVRPDWNRTEKPDGGQLMVGQMSTSGNQSNYSSFRTTSVIDYSYLKGDLVKTALLAAVNFSAIFLIYFYQGKANQILKLLSPIFHR